MYPNLKEDNPSKIVSGFGGTFCLVISFIYIGISVILLGIGSPYGSPWQMFHNAGAGQQALFMGLFIAFSLIVGLAPLGYALRRARTFEH
jgi:ABC-2 type transport system permease protein